MIVTVQFDPSQADDAAKLGLLFGGGECIPSAIETTLLESEPEKPKTRKKRQTKADKDPESELAQTKTPEVTLETIGAKFKECQAKNQADAGRMIKGFLDGKGVKTVRDINNADYSELITVMDQFLDNVKDDESGDDSFGFGT